MILQQSYLHNGISYTSKTSLYWIRAQVTILSEFMTMKHIEAWANAYHYADGMLEHISLE